MLNSSLIHHAVDLLRRLDGRTRGVATLALWRAFGWNDQGSPKKGFELSAQESLGSEAAGRRHLRQKAGERR